MLNRARITLLAAVIALFGFAGTAAASTVSLSPAGRFSVSTLGWISFLNMGGLIDLTVSCQSTLTGSLDASFADVPGTHAGSVTGGSFGDCDAGTFSYLFAEPASWDLTLEDADLTAKKLTLRLHDYSYEYVLLGNTCLYTGDLDLTVPLTGSGPYTTGLADLAAATLTKAGGGALCAPEVAANAQFSLTTQTVTVR
jgi:hypothetical protein